MTKTKITKTLHFERVGRNKSTFDVEVSAAMTLEGLCDEYDTLASHVRKHMKSTPDFTVDDDGKRIYIVAGFHIVGTAWFVENGGAE